MEQRPVGSTVPRRQLGRQLQSLRMLKGYTVKRAAVLFGISEVKLWRIETGRTSVRASEVEAMCEEYGASPSLKEALVGLAGETKKKDWWYAFNDVIPDEFNLFIGLEQAASEIKTFQSSLVPGLLQTAGYARAIFQAGLPDAEPREFERRVRLRTTRRSILDRAVGAPELKVALSEAVLKCPVGSGEVMAEQLRSLAGGIERVALRIVPFGAGLHEGMLSGPFTIFHFPLTPDGDETEPPTVYCESHAGALYLDNFREVRMYEKTFRNIWDAALTPEESRNVLFESARSYEDA
ncbi:helix-turn-helix domain-containing protein [Kitasatospora sp. NPDC006697]|uniref:helix-turn-helix domain-containing protein n=1 Tax=Kitasatospora sp. NPDC006697 TaxID=3364020 RepID=UPI0036A4C194